MRFPGHPHKIKEKRGFREQTGKEKIQQAGPAPDGNRHRVSASGSNSDYIYYSRSYCLERRIITL